MCTSESVNKGFFFRSHKRSFQSFLCLGRHKSRGFQHTKKNILLSKTAYFTNVVCNSKIKVTKNYVLIILCRHILYIPFSVYEIKIFLERALWFASYNGTFYVCFIEKIFLKRQSINKDNSCVPFSFSYFFFFLMDNATKARILMCHKKSV